MTILGGFSILYLWHLFLGFLPIIFITADIWRAFKKRKHWVPAVSLVLSSFSVQLLTLLCNSLGTQDMLLAMIAGRASVCVFIGYLLPAAASPLSSNMWTDMAALIVGTSVPLLHIGFEIIYYDNLYSSSADVRGDGGTEYNISPLFGLEVAVFPDYYPKWRLMVGWNLAIFVSIMVLLALLSCAIVASVGIHQIVGLKIPIILSPQKFNHQFSWEKIEEHIITSVFVVRSSNPQYILARSSLTSLIALITTISIGIVIHASSLEIREQAKHTFDKEDGLQINISSSLLVLFIMLGSGVIFWRCITATIHYPRKISWKWSSIKQYFKMENFWFIYLKELEGRSLGVEGIGRSGFKKLMNKLWRGIVLYRSIRMLIWIQTFLVVFSKACWLVLQVLLSNKYMERLFMRSATQEFSYINREKDQLGIVLGKAFEFDKYCKALMQLPGESPAGIWIANKKSIEIIKKLMKRGEDEGRKCNELMWLLKHKSSLDFSGEKHVNPHQNYLAIILEVEGGLDVSEPSFKMAVVSLVTLLAELASFIPINNHNNLINRAMEACSQAWDIMDFVEDSESQAVMLSKSADKIFQDLQKSHTWLGYHLPLSKGVGNSVEAAKASIKNVVDKAKQMATEYKSRKLGEVIAGYRLYWLSLNLNYQELTSVEEIVDKMCSILADVIAACTVKAVGVAVMDCNKWAAMFDEESILRAAHIVGKVRNLMENVEWQLKWNYNAGTQSVETSVDRASNDRLLRKYATFQARSMT